MAVFDGKSGKGGGKSGGKGFGSHPLGQGTVVRHLMGLHGARKKSRKHGSKQRPK